MSSFQAMQGVKEHNKGLQVSTFSVSAPAELNSNNYNSRDVVSAGEVQIDLLQLLEWLATHKTDEYMRFANNV